MIGPPALTGLPSRLNGSLTPPTARGPSNNAALSGRQPGPGPRRARRLAEGGALPFTFQPLSEVTHAQVGSRRIVAPGPAAASAADCPSVVGGPRRPPGALGLRPRIDQ